MSPFVILLVEDEVRYHQLYESAITEALSATVRFATTGEEAMAVMNGPEPADLVLLDLQIPGIDGRDVLTRIKADHRLRYTPVIVLTGQSGDELQLELLDKGADDFIVKGEAPEILIARIRTQMRHKIAVDRLERLALDRDLFAAGVLHDISSIKWTIISLCRGVKDKMRTDPVGEKAAVLDLTQKLGAHASKLGQYAADVIQSVRDTNREPSIGPQDLGKHVEWVIEVLGDTAKAKVSSLTWSAPSPLSPVLADKNFLKLVLLNVVQFALARTLEGQPLHLEVTQERRTSGEAALRRPQLVTRITDTGAALPAKELETLFKPYATQGSPRGERDQSGLSLGLSLVGKVVTKMDGTVWAEAAGAASGITVCLALPAV